MAGAKGFEPSIFSVTGRRVNRATPRTHVDSSLLGHVTWGHVAGATVPKAVSSGKITLLYCLTCPFNRPGWLNSSVRDPSSA